MLSACVTDMALGLVQRALPFLKFWQVLVLPASISPSLSLFFSPLFSLSHLPYFQDFAIIKITFWLGPYLTYISEKLAISLCCPFPGKLKPCKPSELQWLWNISSGKINMHLSAKNWHFCFILCEIKTR